jgi:8-oxo-dGTP diphosphatase
VQQWLVGGALIEASVVPPDAGVPASAPGLLLVQNLRRGGIVDWTPPGGVIDEGESLLGGLTREVTEETGLEVGRWDGPVYEISAEAPGLGWHLRVEVHRAVEVTGVLRVGADPDGIVVEAAVVPEPECEERLGRAHPWVREPLVEWMAQRWSGTRSYHYRVDGTDVRDLRVTRRDGPVG